MKVIILFSLLLLQSSTTNANQIIEVYNKKTTSLFPDQVKNFVNKAFSSNRFNCNPDVKLIIETETVKMSSENSGIIFYNGSLRAYNEVDQHTVRYLAKIDSSGTPYRQRSFSVVKENGKLKLSSISCESIK